MPAGVLMCSMFRPFAGMSKYAFAPQGLDNLCIPSGNEERPEVLFFTSARSSTGMQPENAPGILNSLSWMHAFPSARRMWDSALDHVLTGRLDLSLPKGSFSFYGRSSPAGDRLLITELHLMLLRTEEEPFPAYSAHTRDIEFERVLHSEDRVTGGTGNPITKAALPSRAGCYTLDDDEWAQISRIAVARKPQPCPMRQMVGLHPG